MKNNKIIITESNLDTYIDYLKLILSNHNTYTKYFYDIFINYLIFLKVNNDILESKDVYKEYIDKMSLLLTNLKKIRNNYSKEKVLITSYKSDIYTNDQINKFLLKIDLRELMKRKPILYYKSKGRGRIIWKIT